jgi:hypothetical protein
MSAMANNTKRTTAKKPTKKPVAASFDVDAEKAAELEGLVQKVFKYQGRDWRLIPFVRATNKTLSKMQIDSDGNILLAPPEDGDRASVRDWLITSFEMVIHADDFDEFIEVMFGDPEDPDDEGDVGLSQDVMTRLLEWCNAQVGGDPT